MAESACLMPTTFSLPSDCSLEAKEGTPMDALGESISFGRFMSESLAWERWSSFNSNRYLEEVEKYSKPGSVAQKKAYFEAHYKKKAAALLEQADNNDSKLEIDDGHCDGDDMDLESHRSDSILDIDRAGEEEVSAVDAIPIADANTYFFNEESAGMVANAVEEVAVLENPLHVDNSMQMKSTNLPEDVENKVLTDVEISPTEQSENLPLKEILAGNQESSASTPKRKPSASSSKASPQSRASKLPPSPRPRTPASRKENKSTLDSKKTVKDSEAKMRLTPKSIHMSLNFAPSPSPAGDIKKIAKPILQSARDTKAPFSSTKTPKVFPAPPVGTPNKLQASTNSMPKLRPVTPQPVIKRTKPPLEPKALGSRKVDMKSQSLSMNDSKFSSASGNKAGMPSVSSSFSFRSEERAAKRKEYFQKLEEQSNAREAQKLELLAKSKEKAETELRKLRQNLGFKAKPMPDFTRETPPSSTQIKKIPLTRPRSPKLGRKPSFSSTVTDINSRPPKALSVKSDVSTGYASDKSKRTTTTRSVTSLPKKECP